VEEVGAVTILPAQGNTNTYYVVGEEDYEDPSVRKITNHRYVFPGYFEALDLPVLEGRGVLESDRPGTSLVAVVNESLARRHWPDGNVIGQRINTGGNIREVVGIVADIRDPGLRESNDFMVYFSALQRERRFMSWAIEASVPLATLVEPAKAKVRELDPTVPVTDVMAMNALVDQALGAYLIMVKIMTAVAIIALILALGGVYGVVGYSVSRRTQEMGVRMSLGARAGEVMGMVIRQGARLTLIGVVVGVVLALGVTRGLSFFLFGVSPFDFSTFCTGALLLLGAGVAATVVPARRATRVNPVEALRRE
jgi:predicted permease